MSQAATPKPEQGADVEQVERHLILCETNYALFVSLLLRCNGVIAGDCDVIFTDALDFSDAARELRSTGLFGDIWQVETRGLVTQAIRRTDEERRELGRHPETFMPVPFGDRKYSDLWLNLDGQCAKYFYYSLVNLGSAPDVHFVEEGNASYYLNLETLKRDCMPHAEYGKLRFEKACRDIWLFEPDRFQAQNVGFAVRGIPREYIDDDRFRALVPRIFEASPLPDKPFIFFEQCFSADASVTDDLDIVMRVADVLGKDNISIRLHPRTKEDRFKPFGFHTASSGSSLWEALLLENPDFLSDKVIVTVDSSAAFSSMKLFGKPTESILLDRIIWGTYKGKDAKGKVGYFDDMAKASNEGGLRCHRPYTYEELDIILECQAREMGGRHDR